MKQVFDRPSATPSAIVIVGSGVVGTATGEGFLELGHDVTFVDISERRVQRAAGARPQRQHHRRPPGRPLGVHHLDAPHAARRSRLRPQRLHRGHRGGRTRPGHLRTGAHRRRPFDRAARHERRAGPPRPRAGVGQDRGHGLRARVQPGVPAGRHGRGGLPQPVDDRDRQPPAADHRAHARAARALRRRGPHVQRARLGRAREVRPQHLQRHEDQLLERDVAGRAGLRHRRRPGRVDRRGLVRGVDQPALRHPRRRALRRRLPAEGHLRLPRLRRVDRRRHAVAAGGRRGQRPYGGAHRAGWTRWTRWSSATCPVPTWHDPAPVLLRAGHALGRARPVPLGLLVDPAGSRRSCTGRSSTTTGCRCRSWCRCTRRTR